MVFLKEFLFSFSFLKACIHILIISHCDRYEVDEISPDDPLFEEGYSYWILSKTIKPQKPKTKTTAVKTEDKENVSNGTVNGANAMATNGATAMATS